MEYSKQQHFDSDYMEGAHPKILERLMETNMVKTPGYGGDDYGNRDGCNITVFSKTL